LTHTEDFKVTASYDTECLRNGTRYRHNYNGILSQTYTDLLQGVISTDFGWPHVT